MAIQLPALDIQAPPQQPGVLDNYAKGVQLKTLLGNQQLQQMQIQEESQKIKDQQAMTASMQQWDGKWETLPGLVQKNGGSANAVIGLKKGITEQQKSEAALTKDKIENMQAQNDAILQAHSAVDAVPPAQRPAVYQQQLQSLSQVPGLDVSKFPQQYPGDEPFKMFGAGLVGTAARLTALARDKAADKESNPTQASLAVKAAAGDKQAQAALDALAPADKNPTEASLAMKAAGGDQGAEAALKRLDKSKREARPVNVNLLGGNLSSEALDMNANRFLSTGQMPVGLRNPLIAKQIMNRAAELGAGTNIAANSAEYAANKDSYKHATGTLDTLTAFENVGMKNLDNFLRLAQKIPDTGVPWLNTPVRNLNKSVVGSANMPAIDAARTVALREIARITNDPKLKGVLTDSARKEVEDLIPANATLPQIVAVAKVLKQDVANVHSSVAAQKQVIGQRLGINTPQETQTAHPSGHAAGDTRQYNGATYKFDGNQWVKE